MDRLTYRDEFGRAGIKGVKKEDFLIAAESLDKVQAALDKLANLEDRNTMKKVKVTKGFIHYYHCPNCDYDITRTQLKAYCPDCGQLIDWE